MGAGFPSDCILSIIPAVLVIFTYWIGSIIASASDVCPKCDGGFCYYNLSGSDIV